MYLFQNSDLRFYFTDYTHYDYMNIYIYGALTYLNIPQQANYQQSMQLINLKMQSYQTELILSRKACPMIYYG